MNIHCVLTSADSFDGGSMFEIEVYMFTSI